MGHGGWAGVERPGTPGPSSSGETYYWAPGHNLEAVTDAEYIEITRSEDYDALMAHCKRVLAS